MGGSQPLYGRPERVGDLFGVVFRDGIMGTRMAVVAIVSLICSYWTGSGGWSSGSAGDPWWRWKDLASDGAFLRGLDNKHSSIVDKFRQLVCCQSFSVAQISNSYVTEASDTRPFHYSHDMYGQHLRALSWWYRFYSTQYRGHHGHHINALATRTRVERGTALRKSSGWTTTKMIGYVCFWRTAVNSKAIFQWTKFSWLDKLYHKVFELVRFFCMD